MTVIQNLQTKAKTLDNSFGLLIFLQLFAVALCFGGPLALFASVPIVLAFLVFGRVPTLLFASIFASLVWYVSIKYSLASAYYLTGLHLIAIASGVLISEVIFRNINPVKGLMVSGFIFVSLLGGLIVTNEKFGKVSTRNQIAEGIEQVISTIKVNNKDKLDLGDEEGRALKTIISKKNEIIEEVMASLPAIIFVTSFFVFWISLYSVLRLAKVWRFKNLYSFGTRDLLSFKTPEYFVYPLILSLVLVIGASYGFGKSAEIIGGNILYCLGVFYLFQGFGIFYDFLTFAKIGGVFKSAILAFILMVSFKFLAVIGMFDLWFNFRKYFIRKKNDEGDML